MATENKVPRPVPVCGPGNNTAKDHVLFAHTCAASLPPETHNAHTGTESPVARTSKTNAHADAQIPSARQGARPREVTAWVPRGNRARATCAFAGVFSRAAQAPCCHGGGGGADSVRRQGGKAAGPSWGALVPSVGSAPTRTSQRTHPGHPPHPAPQCFSSSRSQHKSASCRQPRSSMPRNFTNSPKLKTAHRSAGAWSERAKDQTNKQMSEWRREGGGGGVGDGDVWPLRSDSRALGDRARRSLGSPQPLDDPRGRRAGEKRASRCQAQFRLRFGNSAEGEASAFLASAARIGARLRARAEFASALPHANTRPALNSVAKYGQIDRATCRTAIGRPSSGGVVGIGTMRCPRRRSPPNPGLSVPARLTKPAQRRGDKRSDGDCKTPLPSPGAVVPLALAAAAARHRSAAASIITPCAREEARVAIMGTVTASNAAVLGAGLRPNCRGTPSWRAFTVSGN
ncbi:unnamed protein product [Lampetra planeri]